MYKLTTRCVNDFHLCRTLSIPLPSDRLVVRRTLQLVCRSVLRNSSLGGKSRQSDDLMRIGAQHQNLGTDAGH